MQSIKYKILHFILININFITLSYCNENSNNNNIIHNNNPDFRPEVINNNNTNIQLGTVNIKKSIIFTNKDNNKQQYRTKFNNINENNLVEIYTKSGMSNVELNGGNYKTQDIVAYRQMKKRDENFEKSY